jgi:hypothetical protein
MYKNKEICANLFLGALSVIRSKSSTGPGQPMAPGGYSCRYNIRGRAGSGPVSGLFAAARALLVYNLQNKVFLLTLQSLKNLLWRGG